MSASSAENGFQNPQRASSLVGIELRVTVRAHYEDQLDGRTLPIWWE
jgi:hypothetical protein